jgi:ubiquinol-cytochrome c reductase cytochrome b subunit
MDPVNFDPADGLKTQAHIYPEWYFLWSYEILRPFSTDIGLMAFAFSQVIFVALPFLDRSPNAVPASRRGLFKYWFWAMLIDMIALTAMGKLPPEGAFSTIGFVAAVVFIGLWIALPIITYFEKKV